MLDINAEMTSITFAHDADHCLGIGSDIALRKLLKMKTFYFVLLTVTILLVRCQNNQTSDLEVEKLRTQRDSLLEVSVQKDSSINAFLISFSEIENNLKNIRARQEDLTIRWRGQGELKGDVRERVVEDIKIINELMEQNTRKIEGLTSIVNGNNIQITELNGTVNLLIQHIKDKNNELIMVNKTLEEKNKELAQRNKIVFRVPR